MHIISFSIRALRTCITIQQEKAMLSWAVTFFVIAIIAAVLGFGGIAGGASSIAQILFVVFLILAAVSFFRGRSSKM